jgi:hypothetical protein
VLGSPTSKRPPRSPSATSSRRSRAAWALRRTSRRWWRSWRRTAPPGSREATTSSTAACRRPWCEAGVGGRGHPSLPRTRAVGRTVTPRGCSTRGPHEKRWWLGGFGPASHHLQSWQLSALHSGADDRDSPGSRTRYRRLCRPPHDRHDTSQAQPESWWWRSRAVVPTHVGRGYESRLVAEPRAQGSPRVSPGRRSGVIDRTRTGFSRGHSPGLRLLQLRSQSSWRGVEPRDLPQRSGCSTVELQDVDHRGNRGGTVPLPGFEPGLAAF